MVLKKIAANICYIYTTNRSKTSLRMNASLNNSASMPVPDNPTISLYFSRARGGTGPAQPGGAGASAGPPQGTDEGRWEPQDHVRLLCQQGAEELARRPVHGECRKSRVNASPRSDTFLSVSKPRLGLDTIHELRHSPPVRSPGGIQS